MSSRIDDLLEKTSRTFAMSIPLLPTKIIGQRRMGVSCIDNQIPRLQSKIQGRWIDKNPCQILFFPVGTQGGRASIPLPDFTIHQIV